MTLNEFTQFCFFLFIHKRIYNRHINKTKKAKTKIHITVIRYKATVTPDIKLKEEQVLNYWVIDGLIFFLLLLVDKRAFDLFC